MGVRVVVLNGTSTTFAVRTTARTVDLLVPPPPEGAIEPLADLVPPVGRIKVRPSLRPSTSEAQLADRRPATNCLLSLCSTAQVAHIHHSRLPAKVVGQHRHVLPCRTSQH